jgi:hypothetical protein
MKTYLLVVLEMLSFVAIVMIAEAFGFLDPLINTGLFVGFWLCPLLAAALHIYVFCRSARALKMPLLFVVGTLVTLAALLAGVLEILRGHAAIGIATVAASLVLTLVISLLTERLPKLAIGESDLSLTFGSFPSEPHSRYATLPMMELVLGAGSILLAHVTPISRGHGIWIYVPVALWVALGTIFQIYHLRSHYSAASCASPSDQI